MNQSNLKVFKSQKGGLKIQLDGFVYNKNRQNSEKCYWNCEYKKHNVYKCRATLITNVFTNVDSASLLSCNDVHSHEGIPFRADVADSIQSLKSKTIDQPTVKTCQILQNHLASTSSDIATEIPSKDALRQIITREKKKKLHTPTEPMTFNFDPDLQATQYDSENNFIIKDRIFSESKRVTLFSTIQLINFLCQAIYLVMDGTFKIVPTIYQQLYTIHGPVNDSVKTFPLLFALCTHKDKASYDMMLDLLLEFCAEHALQFSPSYIVMDFERAAILSLRQHFETVTLRGCFFHLRQIIYRKLQREHLSSQYNQNGKFNKEIKCILALSFVHPVNVDMYLKDLVEILSEDARNIADWFNEYYVNGKNNQQPLYSPTFWCLNSHNSIPRTQNSAESFHHHINEVCSKRHVGFYRLVAELIKEVKVNDVLIAKIQNGETPAKKRKNKNEMKIQNIENILKNITDYSHVELLQAIANNL